MAGLRILDDEGEELVLDAEDVRGLRDATGGFEGATVSACSRCGSCVLAAVALVDLLDAGAPHARSTELAEFAEDAPTLHLYVVDDAAACDHARWLDPGHAEWADVVEGSVPRARR